MKPITAVASLVLLIGASAFAQPTAAPAASAPAAPAASAATAPALRSGNNGLPPGGATQACELAVRATLRNTRGAAAEVSFNAPPAAAPGAAEGGEMLLRGAGRAKSGGSARTFTYSCTYDTKSDSVAGVVLRDAAPAGDRAATTAPVRTVEPDLSQISPAACESAAASALKRRWPNVGRIAFNADTRSLIQDSAGTAKLEGQGTAQPQIGSDTSSHFRYQCALDAASGKVLALRLVD
jgi:hypothetical protein